MTRRLWPVRRPPCARLHGEGASLLVTVDCGAAAHDALAAAREIGLDAIVLDHHAVEQNPPALAHVNPNGPDDASGFTYICAAGLAFMFLVAVQRHLRDRRLVRAHGIERDRSARLISISWRWRRLPMWCRSRRQPRLRAPGLAQAAAPGAPGPCGAGADCRGRSRRSPPIIWASSSVRASMPAAGSGAAISARVCWPRTMRPRPTSLRRRSTCNNRERQAIEASILEAAQAMAASQSDAVLLVARRRLASRRRRHRRRPSEGALSKPAFVAGFDDSAALGRGSARSVPGVDVGAIMRRAHAEGLLEAGGGHAMAAGFSVARDKLEAFREFLRRAISSRSATTILRRAISIADAIVSAAGATLALLDDLERAGPFGAGQSRAGVRAARYAGRLCRDRRCATMCGCV